MTYCRKLIIKEVEWQAENPFQLTLKILCMLTRHMHAYDDDDDAVYIKFLAVNNDEHNKNS